MYLIAYGESGPALPRIVKVANMSDSVRGLATGEGLGFGVLEY